MTDRTPYWRWRIITPTSMTVSAPVLCIWMISTFVVNIFPKVGSPAIIRIINMTLPAEVTEIFSSSSDCPGQETSVHLSSYKIVIG